MLTGWKLRHVMSFYRNILISGAFLGSVLVPSISAHANSPSYSDNPDPSCAVYAIGTMDSENTSGSMFTTSNGTISATVVVTGPSSCTETVSMASWQAPIGSTNFLPLNDQKLLYSTTQTLGVGAHVLTLKIADCDYQVDILDNASPTADGTPTYVPSSRLFGWIQAGNQVCEPAPVTTTPTPTTPITAPTPVTPVAVTPVATPPVLVNTGAGNTIGLFASVAALTAGLHYIVTRRKLTR
jgi:hypothetical protein